MWASSSTIVLLHICIVGEGFHPLPKIKTNGRAQRPSPTIELLHIYIVGFGDFRRTAFLSVGTS